MNVFLYDVYLDKYKKSVKNVEEILNKLNLQGKIIYLKDVKNLKDLLSREIDNGAKTLISVGNNKTLNTIVNILANFSEKIPIATIPIGPQNSISASLGISDEKEACYVLSSRRIEKIKLIKANDLLFIKSFFIESKDTSIYINDSYRLFPQNNGSCFVYNLSPKEEPLKNIKISPQDDILNLYIETKPKSKTHLLAQKIEIKNDKKNGLIDDLIEIKTPVDIRPSDKTIEIIVGKERTF
ncbi:MAG: diacylglycerol kinase family protein [Patescibacteria group bacterium]|jgi:hypothetical protein